MAGHKNYGIGEEALAADWNAYVMDQIVAEYPTAAARTAGWPAPPNGACSALTSLDTTHGIYQWNGTAWRKPWAMPWGALPGAPVQSTTGQSNIPVGSYVDIVNLTLTVTNVANRLLRIMAQCWLNAPAATDVLVLAIRDGTNAVINTTRRAHYTGAEMQDLLVVGHVAPTVAGTATYKISATKNGASPGAALAVAGPIQWLMVEDLGPFGAPA